MKTQIDLNWLSGLMEGEGSFTLHHPKREKDKGYPGAPKIQLKMTDEDVMQRAASIFDCKVYGPYTNKARKDGQPKKDVYSIQISVSKAVPWMRLLLPLMGERRQGRIKELLEYYTANCKYRGWNGRGKYVEYDPK